MCGPTRIVTITVPNHRSQEFSMFDGCLGMFGGLPTGFRPDSTVVFCASFCASTNDRSSMSETFRRLPLHDCRLYKYLPVAPSLLITIIQQHFHLHIPISPSSSLNPPVLLYFIPSFQTFQNQKCVSPPFSLSPSSSLPGLPFPPPPYSQQKFNLSLPKILFFFPQKN